MTRFYFMAVGLLLGSCTAAVAQQLDLKQALVSHHYGDALAMADQELQQRPDDAHLWFARGLALGGLGKTHQSLASFDHALNLAPNALPVMEAAAQMAYSAHDAHAKNYLNRILQVDSSNQVANAMSGVLDFEGHDCPAAIRHFERAAPAMAGNLSAEMQYGSCLKQTGKDEQAATLFARLAQTNPGNALVQYDEALIEYDGKRYANAIRVLTAMQAAGQTLHGETMNLLGAAYADGGQIEQAVQAYREGARQDPHYIDNYIDLAALSVNHQSFQVALDVLNIGIQNNPNSAALYTTRGAVRTQISQNDAAAEDFETASRLAPSKLYGTVGLGMLLRDSTKLPQAEKLLRDKLRSAPNNAILNYLLADVIVRGGVSPGQPRYNEARTLLARAVKLQPDLAMAYGELGMLDLAAGKTEPAIRALEAGVHYDPTDRMSLYQLVAAYRRAGRESDAKRVAVKLGKAVDQERSQEAKRDRVELVIAGSAAQ